MVVQHNLKAMNANRMLGLTTASQAKSTEKLSSGYKINRAADDAAGLSISEKMRKQIRGLTQASANAQDGISAVQTAEGALTEVHDMLQRMNELAVKASNGTMSENDRSYVQNEIDQLVTEIDRVSETTKFNETYLLKGNGVKSAVADKTYADLGADKAITAKITNAEGSRTTATSSTDTKTGVTTLNLGDLKNIKAGDSISIDGVTYTFNSDAAASAGSTDEDFTAGWGTTVKKAVKIGLQKWNGSATANRSTDEIAEQLATAIKTATTKNNAANVNTGNVASASVMKDAEGNYILTTQSKIDANRATTTAATLTTDGGVAVGVSGGQTIADGDVISVGEVKLVGTMTNATGVVANPKTGTFSINLDKYEGEAMKLVYDATDSVWNTEDADGNIKSFTSAELAEMGIGVKSNTAATTDPVTPLDDTTNGFDTLATGFTLTIEKGAVAKSSDKALIADAAISLKGVDLSKYELGDEIKIQANVTAGGNISFSDVSPEEEEAALELSLQVGADTTAENKIDLTIESMSAKSLGIEGLRVDGEDSTNADAAVNTIADAIQKVSTQRSALGAVQNRLEHTINNLDNVVENTTSAESAIRDTDMASEMVKYSNNNILAQAGQSMLAQANQSNQGVLSLLG